MNVHRLLGIGEIRLHLTSNCIEQYHPVKSYLDSLPEWDGHDRIADLLGMVHCRDCTPEKFDFYVRRWLVAMVAATIDDEVVTIKFSCFLVRKARIRRRL